MKLGRAFESKQIEIERKKKLKLATRRWRNENKSNKRKLVIPTTPSTASKKNKPRNTEGSDRVKSRFNSNDKVYFIYKNATNTFGCELREIKYKNKVVGVELIRTPNPNLQVPVLIKAINGVPIVPMTINIAVALVLKVDGIQNPCRFDVMQRLNPLTLYDDNVLFSFFRRCFI